jgi:CDP-glycerol glycerophosphotransferase (TagB/SpsB family)
MKHKILFVLFGLITRIIPREKNIWVFGGSLGRRFADNSRYLFIYSNLNTNKKCIWLTSKKYIVKLVRAMGYKAFLSNSIQGIYYGLRADWHIFDVSHFDIHVYSSIGAKQLNIWHGIPIKNLTRFLSKEEHAINIKRRIRNWFNQNSLKKKNHFMVYPNRRFSNDFLNAFSLSESNLIISNQPRNIVFYRSEKDCLIYKTKKEIHIYREIEDKKKEGSIVLGFFPTWRSDGSERLMGTEKIHEIKELNDLLLQNNAYMVAKRHTCSFKQYKHNGYSLIAEENERFLSKLSNFIILDYEIDLNSIITLCDVLISDYSGAIIDFLLTDKPIIIYAHDLRDYQKNPGLYFDYNTVRFGHLAKSMQELISVINRYFSEPEKFSDEFQSKRKILEKSFFETDECFRPIMNILINDSFIQMEKY